MFEGHILAGPSFVEFAGKDNNHMLMDWGDIDLRVVFGLANKGSAALAGEDTAHNLMQVKAADGIRVGSHTQDKDIQQFEMVDRGAPWTVV